MKLNKPRTSGFTVIELMVTITIIAILISITIPSFKAMQHEALNARVQKELKNLVIAIEVYSRYHNQYPYPDQTQAAYGNRDIAFQQELMKESPSMIQYIMEDPYFNNYVPAMGHRAGYGYIYNGPMGANSQKTSKYFVVYSRGPQGNGSIALDENGKITLSGSAIWDGNGHL